MLCALFPRLCANASTVAEALKAIAPRRRPRRRPAPGPAAASPAGACPGTGKQPAPPEFADLPSDPGVYLFRDDAGRVLYVGKSVSIRSRARAHFAPSTRSRRLDGPRVGGRLPHAPSSELGALVLENRLIKELAPPGNNRLTRRDDRLIYIRCRLDIAFPILEVSPNPAAGHAVTIGPLRGRRLALELVEQLDSLFGLRHCGRRLPRREYPSAYGQMGRCLSPCLGDLDPNLYRRRLDEMLRLFLPKRPPTRPASGCSTTSSARCARRPPSSASNARPRLRRRLRRLGVVLGRLVGVLEATHARPRLVLAPHPNGADFDASGSQAAGWWTGGRWAAVIWTSCRRGRMPRSPAAGRIGELGAHVPPDEIDELRILGSWLGSHPDTPQLALRPAPGRAELEEFLHRSRQSSADASSAGRSSASEGQLDDQRGDLVGADGHL